MSGEPARASRDKVCNKLERGAQSSTRGGGIFERVEIVEMEATDVVLSISG